MKNLIKEHNLTILFHILVLILFAFLFCTSIFITGSNNDDIRDEYIYIERNSPLQMLLIIALFLTFMFLVGKAYEKVLYKCNRNILLGVVCLLSFGISIYWILASGTAPQADQLTVLEYAKAFSQGDFSSLMEPNYLTRCLHQLGLVTFHRILFYFFGYGNYIAFQIFSAAMVPVLVFSGCQIVRRLSVNNGMAEIYYLVLAGTCFPMYAYTAFVYGEMASTALILLATWILLSCLEKFSVSKLTGLAFIVGLAVQLRKNVLIVLIAFEIVIFIKFWQKREWKVFLTGCSILLGAFLFQASVEGIYSNVRNKEAEQIPAVLYIAMGLHDTYGYPGWNDFYQHNAFAETGDNVEVATEVGRADIRKSMERFLEDPAYMLYFFQYKINSQWQAPMYQSIAVNNCVAREQSSLVRMIYEKKLPGQLIEQYMKAFQFFLYGCIFLWLIRNFKKEMPLVNYVLLIAVFGGFLFTVMWEAKTRYALPYMLLMLPNFGLAMQEFMAFLVKPARFLKRKLLKDEEKHYRG